MSLRNLDRYLAILDTPQVVQDAFEGGELGLVAASRVAFLEQDKQLKIAAKITDGEPPKEVVAKHLKRSTATPDKAYPFERSIDAVIRHCRAAAAASDDWDGCLPLSTRQSFEEGLDFLTRVRARIAENPANKGLDEMFVEHDIVPGERAAIP